MPYDPRDPDYFDAAAVEKELPASPSSATAAGAAIGSAPRSTTCWTRRWTGTRATSKITSADYRRIVDLCWQCKLCYNHCPYTPPHHWDIDFPRLMLRAKAARAARKGSRGRTAGSATWTRWARFGVRGRSPHQLGERLPAPPGAPRGGGRHRSPPQAAAVPPQDVRPLVPRAAAGGRREGRKVAFFYSCSVNYNEPQVGRDAVAVLEKNGCAVSCPEQVCCGMPYLDGGDLDGRRRATRARTWRALLPLVEEGATVVVPQPTCSYVLKKEYPMLRPRRGRGEGRGRHAGPVRVPGGAQAGRARSPRTSRAGGPARSRTRCPATCGPRTWATRRGTSSSSFPARGSRRREVHGHGRHLGHEEGVLPDQPAVRAEGGGGDGGGQPETFATDCTLTALQIEAVRGEKPAHPDDGAARGLRAARGALKAMRKDRPLRGQEPRGVREGPRGDAGRASSSSRSDVGSRWART